jgi:outer membrane protein OmpA-like peptidoglycan-associated protein
MPHAHARPRPFLSGLVLAQAFVLCLIPLASAFAQSPPYVRVTRDKIEISVWRLKEEVRMTATKGTVLEVFLIEGDRYKHLDSNWYWVSLPKDAWGFQPVGWIRGDAVEDYVMPEPAATPRASLSSAPTVSGPSRNDSSTSTMTAPEPVRPEAPLARTDTARPVVSDVVLNFAFDRSDLTEEAKDTLAHAVALPNAVAHGMVVALEGYADWTGSEIYNQSLGLARAESVRQYLAAQLRITVDRISVVSYGEASPVASNTTRAGRAQNRRVVLKVG